MKALRRLPVTDATLYSSNVPEADHAVWSAATAYTVGQRAIRAAGVHRIFERLVAGATATPPEDDPTSWLDIGPTNRWAMFEDSPSSATAAPSPLSVYLAAGAVNDIVLAGVVGTQVQVYSGSTGTTLVRTVAVPAPVAPATTRTVVITGLGIAAGNRVGVVISGPDTVQCAHLAVGTFATLGQALPGCEVGITDYSVVETDDFGVSSVTVRPYSRWITGSYRTPAADVDAVVAQVESLQSDVTWWQVDPDYECMQTLGWLKSHQLTHRGAGHALVSFRLEGLSRDDAVVQAGAVLPAAPGWALQTATVYLYQRAPTAPAGPSQAITYTFAGPVIDGLHGGWQASIPDGGGPIWIVTAVATGNARSVALRPDQWAAPALMAQNGATGAPGANAPWIKVAGTNYNAAPLGAWLKGVWTSWGYAYVVGGRGHTLVVINPATQAIVSGPTRYDTYIAATDPAPITALIADLNSVAAGHIVALYSWDATSCTTGLRAALARLGSGRAETWIAQRYTHVFIGAPGLMPGQAYEDYTQDGSATGGRSIQAYISESGLVTGGAHAVSYDVEIESTNGTEFRVGQGTQTLLKAHVFRNDSEVTQDIPESWFRWRRVSLIPQPPPHDDATWNANYATGYRQVNVSVDDVQAKASFFCDIVRPD